MALPKEIWIRALMEGFYPDANFLNYVTSYDEHVDNNKIHMAEAGIDPEVLVDNNTYPIEVTQRDDKPLEFELSKFETKNTLIRRPDAVELSYDKLNSVLRQHRSSLRTKVGEKAAHAYAPQENGEFTPVIETTGTDNGDGYKRLTLADILRLKSKYDDMDIPKEQRFLVLHPNHVADLILSDTKLFKNVTDMVNGKPNTFAGFRMLEYTRNPRYNKDTKVKVDFAAEAADTDTFCSFSFCSEEVMKADGNIKMYIKRDDPEERATIVGFDKRFIALPIRNLGIGSIIAASA